MQYNLMKRLLLPVAAVCLLNSCTENKPEQPDTNPAEQTPAIPTIPYSVKQYHPHDINLFTEGFLFHNGQLFESTGSPSEVPQAKSVVGISDLTTGKFTQKIELDKSKYFGEGIAFFKDKLYQLTYKNRLGFVYDANTFKQTGQFGYTNAEGWGMTTDSAHLIMSDGTDHLTYLDPEKLTPVKTLAVTENGSPRDKLNELEWIKGFIYANIWTENTIVKINPADGKVVGKLDLSSLTYEAANKNPNADVLNGIAYDPATDKIYVTGKLWANIYQIEFAH